MNSLKKQILNQISKQGFVEGVLFTKIMKTGDKELIRLLSNKENFIYV